MAGPSEELFQRIDADNPSNQIFARVDVDSLAAPHRYTADPVCARTGEAVDHDIGLGNGAASFPGASQIQIVGGAAMRMPSRIRWLVILDHLSHDQRVIIGHLQRAVLSPIGGEADFRRSETRTRPCPPFFILPPPLAYLCPGTVLANRWYISM
jgi:hypothetical protein